MAVVVNLEGVKTSLEVIEDGVYPARLVKRTFGISKAKQPKVVLEYVFNEDAGEGVGGRKAFVECSLQPQALFKVKKVLIDMGMDPDDLEQSIDLDEAFSSLMGAEAQIRVGHHEWQDSTRNDFYVVSPESWSGEST